MKKQEEKKETSSKVSKQQQPKKKPSSAPAALSVPSEVKNEVVEKDKEDKIIDLNKESKDNNYF